MPPLEANVRQVLKALLPKIQSLHESSDRPTILGITGLQGSGKSTWASIIVRLLASEHNLRSVTISLDDLYLDHDGLLARREKDPENNLYRTRGQPGTHDEQLAAQFFEELKKYNGSGELKVPRFDKSKFNGEGDRTPKTYWPSTNTKPNIVVFEGWCIGFQPLPSCIVEEKYHLARSGQLPLNTLANHKLEHLLEVNAALKRYCDAFLGPQHFDFLIHIDTDDLRNVYKWRLEQEHKLIAVNGMGMKDDEVEAFINGYMPGYELYLDRLRTGFFDEKPGAQIRVILDTNRRVKKVEEL
jgi:D-glycerate 3-kinase